jgi:hypothetical protein
LLTAGLVFAGVLGVASPASAATGNILPPFTTGETWYVYQGYGPNAFSHNNNDPSVASLYGLDLTYGNSTTASAGRTVRAPMSGTVHSYGASYGSLCVDTADGGSYTLTHINGSVTSGSVTAGQAVGTVGAAWSYNNNGVAHIHLQTWSAPGCWANTDGGMPFDSAHGRQICGAPNFTASGPSEAHNGVWSGTSFTGQSCGGTPPPQPKHDELLWYEPSTGVSALGLNATGNGFNKFWTQTGYGAPDWAGVGDMNGDGHDDLVWYDPNGTVNVETMNSAKNGLRLLFQQTGYGHPVWAGIGDINGDGKDDLLWYENNYTISAVTMNGSGTGFSLLFRATSFAVPTWAGVGDVNGDGHDDLLWYNNYTINAETMNGAGTGFNLMFQAPNFAVPTWAGLADLDGAGPDELLWYDSSTTGVSALGLNATGTGFNKFWTQSGYGVPTWAGVGDVNGDGHDDLLWYDGSNYTISAVTMNSAKNGLAPMFQAPSFAVPTWAGLADLDGQ